MLVPGLTYEGMPIPDGGKAMALLADLARGKLVAADAVRAAEDLLAYCRQDSLATVEIFKRMKTVAGA